MKSKLAETFPQRGPSLIVEDMKLYLTSERMGDDSDRLLAMITPEGAWRSSPMLWT